MKEPTQDIRKVTVNLPGPLIDAVLRNEKMGLTEIIRILLEKEKQRKAWQKLSELRGKVKFDLTYEEMKEDRE